ncbi:MAG: TrkH family potassium uptake protein [Desulfohalobiaceae bacterium]|nr:TrkH family potassium uptake protein [Desulfohalobiaceae bacterium]
MRSFTLWLKRRYLHLHPATLILLSFVAVIVAGTLLLKLPLASKSGFTSLIDALFTATSAVCVTGLAVADTSGHFSLFGQIVILGLIQIGGLGLMTFSVLIFRLLGKKISIRERMAVQDLFSSTASRDVYSIIKSIISFTVVAEGLGTLFLFLHLSNQFPSAKAFYLSLFHSVSAFCNAGFSLFSSSLSGYSSDIVMNAVIGCLIVLGGIGFPIVYEAFLRIKHRAKRHSWSLQCKVVCITTVVLIAGGMIVFWFGESHLALQGNNLKQNFLITLFQSITCRTAGFNTIDISTLSTTTLSFMMFLMFVGGSPGSCAGGIKTTTLAVLAAFTWSRIRGKIRTNMFKKSIPLNVVNKCISLIFISVVVIAACLFLLLLSSTHDPNVPHGHGMFLDYLFEVVSAFGTVGLSMGATDVLNTWGKILIMVLMLAGRVGILTMAYVIVSQEPSKGLQYSEENLMIG